MEFCFEPPPTTAYHNSTLIIKYDKLHIMTNDNTLQWLGANILLPDGRELPAGERLHFQGGLTIGYQGVEQKVINTLIPIFFPSV